MTVITMVITADAVFLTIRENLESVENINITLAGYFYCEVMYELLIKDVELKSDLLELLDLSQH